MVLYGTLLGNYGLFTLGQSSYPNFSTILQKISCTLAFTDKNVRTLILLFIFRTHFGRNYLTFKVMWFWPKWSSIGRLVKPCIFKLNITIDTSYCKTKSLIETKSCFGPRPHPDWSRNFGNPVESRDDPDPIGSNPGTILIPEKPPGQERDTTLIHRFIGPYRL